MSSQSETRFYMSYTDKIFRSGIYNNKMGRTLTCPIPIYQSDSFFSPEVIVSLLSGMLCKVKLKVWPWHRIGRTTIVFSVFNQIKPALVFIMFFLIIQLFFKYKYQIS